MSMDGSTPSANSVSEGIDSQSYVHSPNCGKPCLEHKLCVCGNVQETGDITNKGASIENSSIVQELKDSLHGYAHIQEPPEHLSDLHETTYQDETNIIEETSMCQEFYRSVSLETKMLKTLSKSATFSCLEVVQSCSLPSKGRHGLSCIGAQGQCSLKSEGSAYVRSLSLPASVKLVSAMKGGREQNGETPKMNLHVKWAAGVFDPPATSMSHTVRSRHQCPRAKKKDRHKHKHNKGKSSRGMGSERKHTNHKVTGSITDTHDIRMQSTSERSLLDKCGCSDVEVLDYAVHGQESKCGSSFMRESLAKLHVSVAEAS